ncbi:MAG: hypothetical protein ACI9B8_000221, partial [Sulfitobacter sp.]
VTGEPGVAAENLSVDAGAVTFQNTVTLNNVSITGTTASLNQGADLSGTLSVTASQLNVAGQDLVANGGLTASGNVNVSTGVRTSNADITVSGSLSLADDTDITIATSNGDITVVGSTVGTGGAGNESLTLNSGTGSISLSDVFGAGTTDNPGGLTDVIVTNSGAINFGQIAITGSLSQTNAATGNATFNEAVSLGTATLRGTNVSFNDFISTGAVNIVASGNVTQQDGTKLTTAGNLVLSASSLVLNDLETSAQVSFTVVDDATVSHTGDLSIDASIGRNLTLTNNGSVDLAGSIGRDLSITASGEAISSTGITVVGASDYTGLSLNLITSSTGEIVFAIDDDVVIENDQSIVAEGSATNLSLSASSGTISDGGDLQITSGATFLAQGVGGSITLNNAGNAFGSLDVRSVGSVVVNEADDSQLNAVNATDFSLSSAGAVTDGANATISISGATDIDANNDVTLGNEVGDNILLNTIEVDAASVIIGEDSTDGIVVGNLNVDSLQLRSSGGISSVANANIIVTNSAEFNANSGASSVDLASSSNAFGSLSLTGSSISVAERDSMRLTQVSASGDFTANVSGEISDIGIISVGGAATFNAGTQNVTLDSTANKFGSINVSAGDVEIAESDDSNLNLINVDQLVLVSVGNIVQSLTSELSVDGSATLDSGSSNITLLGNSNNFGGLDLSGDVIAINEASATRVESATANQLTLTAAGNITQNNDGAFNVAGLVTLNSGVNDITLAGDTNLFGSLDVTGQSVIIEEADGTNLVALNAATTVIDSVGNIVGTGVLNVAGASSFESDSGSITLNNTSNQFGRLTLIGDVISVVEADSVELFRVEKSTSLSATATAGNITDVTGATLTVAGEVILNASGNVTLGDSDNDAVTFGVVNLVGQEVNLTGQGNISIAGISANNATLVATGTISEQTGAVVTVNDLLSLSAGSSVTLDRGQNSFSRIDLNSAGDASISNTQATVIDELTSVGLTLTAGGDISDNGTVTTTGNTAFTTTGNITLDSEDNSLGILSLTGADVSVRSVTDIVLSRLDASSASISSNQNISDTQNALVSVDGLAIFDARQNISLGSGGNTVQFGSVSLAGASVGVIETDSALILDVDAVGFDYAAGGEIVVTGRLDITNELVLTADEGNENITASNTLNSFSELFVDGADVEVVNSNETELVEVDVQTLNLTSGGNVTDGDEDGITITGLATINAGSTGNIVLGNADSNADNDAVFIGSVQLTGNQVNLTQTNDINVAGLEVNDDLTLTSLTGNITTASDAVVQLVDDGTVTLEVSRADGLIDFTSNSAMGDLTATGLSVSVNEAGDLTLDSINAGAVNLISSGSISDQNGAAIIVAGDAVFTAATLVTLGAGSGPANFGTLNVTATNATIIEDSATVLAGLAIANDITLNSDASVTQNVGADLVVGSTASIDVTGGVLNLNGQFGSLDLVASDIDLTLTGDSVVFGLIADTLDLNALGHQFSIGELNEIRVDQQANIRADRVTFGQDAINEFGGLTVTTSVDGAIEIFSGISSRVAQGSLTNVEGNFDFSSNNITLGATGRTVTVKTSGSELGGSVVFTGIDNDANSIASTGTLSLSGTTAIDVTNGGTTSGANISLMSDAVGTGTIVSTGEGDTSLRVAAGTGNITVGNLAQESQINTFTVTSGGDITLNDLFVTGNTVSLNVSGDVAANGVIQDSIGDISIATTGGSITLSQAITSSGALSLTADAGSLTTNSVTAGGGLNVNASDNVQFSGDVAVTGGDTAIVSAAGSITTGDAITQTGGSFSSAGTGSVSFRSSGALLLGGSTTSGGTLALTSTTGSVTATGPITSASDFNLSANTGISANQIDVTAGAFSVAVGSGDLQFNNNVNVSGDFSALSIGGGFVQAKDTLISSGADIVISTQTGMKIASLSGGTNVTLSIRETNVVADVAAPTFERVNDPITIGDTSAIPDVQSGSGAISYLSQVASVGTADADQNFVQRAGGGIFYGLVNGQFFSDDIGASQVLATAPASVDAALNLFTDASSGLGGLLAGDVFGSDFSAISIQISNDLAGTGNASTNAGQTSASSSSRSTAASQRDDEDEVAEVDEAAFQNLKNYDQNPQGILLPTDQQFAYDDEGNIYFLVTMRTESGQFESFPLFKVDLTLQPAQPLTVATFGDGWATSNEADD